MPSNFYDSKEIIMLFEVTYRLHNSIKESGGMCQEEEEEELLYTLVANFTAWNLRSVWHVLDYHRMNSVLLHCIYGSQVPYYVYTSRGNLANGIAAIYVCLICTLIKQSL